MIRMKIKDICDLQNGRAFKPSDWGTTGLPIIRIQNLNDERAPFNYYSGKYNLAQEVDNGDLLFSWSGTPGTSFGAFLWNRGKGVLNQHIFKVIPKVEVEKTYLMYALNGNISTIISKAHGGVGLQHITKKELDEIEIQMVSISRQKEIVEILEKVSLLIFLRKQQLAKLDELVKARFFEMFGEISDNSMNWDCFTIEKLISTIESGWSGNGKQREKHADEIAVLKVSAVTKGYFIPTECKVLDDQHNIKKYVYPQKGDILFSRANTKEMVGATVLIKKDYPDLILPDKLWKIRFCTDVNPIYMKHVLSTTTVRNAFSAASTGTSGSMYNVSMEKFKGVIIPVPPLPVQNEFVAFAECVDQQKQTVQQSLEKLELMKKALMQEYFG